MQDLQQQITKRRTRISSSYFQPAFLICVGLLAIAAVGMSVAINKFEMYLKKEPLPLKKTLQQLDQAGLGPYKVVLKRKIENKEVVKALGTEEYIQWVLEDTEASADSLVRNFLLFITYYDKPDRVPHVPEECYTGGGYQRMVSDSVTFKVKSGAFAREVPGRYLIFASTKSDYAQKEHRFPVLYFFKVNGIYANSREQARVTLNKNIFGRYSYFTKVEMIFNQKSVMPNKKEAVEAGQKLLSIILPILEKEHWPEWENI